MYCLILINHLKDVSLNIWDGMGPEALVLAAANTTRSILAGNKKPGGNGKVDAGRVRMHSHANAVDRRRVSLSYPEARASIRAHTALHHPSNEGSNSAGCFLSCATHLASYLQIYIRKALMKVGMPHAGPQAVFVLHWSEV